MYLVCAAVLGCGAGLLSAVLARTAVERELARGKAKGPTKDQAKGQAKGSEKKSTKEPTKELAGTPSDPASRSANTKPLGAAARLVSACALALAFPLLLYRYGLSFSTVCLCALAAVLLFASLVDGAIRIIPNGCSLVGALLWMLLCAHDALAAFEAGADPWLELSASLGQGIAGMVVLAGVVLLFSLGWSLVTKRETLGGGDVKLLAMSGLFLGAWNGMLALLVACACAAAYGLVQHLRRAGDGTLAFAPAISLGTMLVLLA